MLFFDDEDRNIETVRLIFTTAYFLCLLHVSKTVLFEGCIGINPFLRMSFLFIAILTKIYDGNW